MRRDAATRATFKVAHLIVAGDYAFVRAGEVVRDGAALQETDLFIEALLRRTGGRSGTARWRSIDAWDLQHERGAQHEAFVQRLHRRIRQGVIPAALLPDDLRPASR